MFNTIVICSDGSANALTAAQTAVGIARENNACVLLLSVDPHAVQTFTVPWQLEAGVTDGVPHINEQQKANFEATVRLCQNAGVHYRFRHETGQPADQIVRVAEEEGADLIVLGSRGLNAWKSLLLGSVSGHVVHHAHCSVLIVR